MDRWWLMGTYAKVGKSTLSMVYSTVGWMVKKKNNHIFPDS
jgi:hypothetical protein